MKYYKRLKKHLNLKKPLSFNEKMQWLKLHDRNDLYTKLADKYEVKKYVSSLIGQDHVIPTYGAYQNFNEIDFSKLPEKFVIKCNHDSGTLVIVDDKFKFDKKSASIKLNNALKTNYYYESREWPYKNITPRIIVEKYILDDKVNELRDYKFFCFNGEPKFMFLATDRQIGETKFNFYDMNFNLTDCKRKDYKLLEYKPEVPVNFEKMKNFSKKLSAGIPHLRVDFYEINGNLYFGELTFFTCSGMIPFKDEKWNVKLGEKIDLKK